MSIPSRERQEPSAANAETGADFNFDFFEPLDASFEQNLDLENMDSESVKPLQDLELTMTQWTKEFFALNDASPFPDMSEDVSTLGEVLLDSQLTLGNNDRRLLADICPIMSASLNTRKDLPKRSNYNTLEALKTSPSIRKPKTSKPSLDSYERGIRRNSHNLSKISQPLGSAAYVAAEKREGTKLGSKEVESHLQKHRMMMRANRERINKKFEDLSNVLCACAWGSKNVRPLRKKTQVLDRAIELCPEMRSRRASLRAELLLYTETSTNVSTLLAATRPMQAAAEMLAHLLLGAQSWKAAEVWMRVVEGLELAAAFASPHNMPITKAKLRSFSAFAHHSKARNSIAERSAILSTSLWVPDLRKIANSSSLIARATIAGISTAMYVPLALGTDGLANVVLVMYHADDELMAYPGGVRPFTWEYIANADELAAAIKFTNLLVKK